MADDRLLKPLPADHRHYALPLDDRTLIMEPEGAGHRSVLELRNHPGSRVDLRPIADLICRHLDEWAQLPTAPDREHWDPNFGAPK